MKTKAVRMYGTMDLRLEEFELPEIKDDEILAKIYSDSLCMSTYKLAIQGKKHKRAPQNMDTHPIITGHEFAGIIVKVGKKWQDQFKPGMRFAQQPALNYKGSMASPGYSYEYYGGDCTYCIFPHETMEVGALMPFTGDAFYKASLGEPLSCSIGAMHAQYHTKQGVYHHEMGLKRGGNLIIMGGCGPMGLGAVSYGVVCDYHPKRIVVTDVNDEKIARAKEVVSPEWAKKYGVELLYVNTAKMEDARAGLMELTDGHGYDDVLIYVPIPAVAELGNSVLAYDGCMSFFSGPSDKNFSAKVNLYDCHYNATHIMGTTGGNNDDLIEANKLAAEGIIDPAVMVTHVGGIDSIAEATKHLPELPGGKKLAYTQFNMPMTAISDFGKLGEKDPFFKELDACCKAHKGLWNAEAEKLIFKHFGVTVDTFD
ncbi:MAG: zinc-binding dehydrogenase [Solobacterium sp.]|jgi:threonine dehydrogenase-like Zn-dependent dehydrogenase|nr:zinc-binding dehydrogenase [Solobacterium sp.]MCH4049389.1 zinc-binding dehydrogenase [Solobacterium sp.]MCH4075245.1 zinc-binding dehydrogenase [Solobacterium sp.]MCI1313390.1 zinc-binding dehydrogenase [Solobacterium sp.]MCI1345641.1 zinc-binding dehydrogenase [Solobacterium sp.]